MTTLHQDAMAAIRHMAQGIRLDEAVRLGCGTWPEKGRKQKVKDYLKTEGYVALGFSMHFEATAKGLESAGL